MQSNGTYAPLGNPNLKPVTLDMLELALNQRSAHGTWGASVFGYQQTHLVETAPDPAAPILLTYTNRSLHAAVVVGYSFGEQTAGTIHDSESFEMLTDLLRWRPRPILVVDPYPERVADRIASAVHRNVSQLRCRWNVLAEFILSGGYRLASQASHIKGAQAITSMYRHFEDTLERDPAAGR